MAEVTEATLEAFLGLTARELVDALGLAEGQRDWTDEPPCVLRGVSYSVADGASVTLYIASGEPLFRQLKLHREWDYDAFLGCRVGGIQYHSTAVRLNVGPAVPWQRRH
ncbi:unnamed protein product [Gemmataceae bacterium]|nr:unnamed protein product [Gemmataceae bacterium]VTU01562.1 unnamed protein product [Gemmataceae bacterium]